jgi:predicted Fe-Mo cluster-binding NifX family protein
MLSPHFGHCETFAFFEVDKEKQEILKTESIPAPPHVPGMLPGWLKEQGADVIIAGGMGGRAVELFEAQSIGLCIGAPSEVPEALVKRFLSGELTGGANTCDHGSQECQH